MNSQWLLHRLCWCSTCCAAGQFLSEVTERETNSSEPHIHSAWLRPPPSTPRWASALLTEQCDELGGAAQTLLCTNPCLGFNDGGVLHACARISGWLVSYISSHCSVNLEAPASWRDIVLLELFPLSLDAFCTYIFFPYLTHLCNTQSTTERLDVDFISTMLFKKDCA